MSDYYTKPESDARFAPIEHTHNIEDLSGTGMAASLVLMPSTVSSFFGDAYALDDGLLDIKSKFEEMNGGFAAVDHTHPDYAAANHVHYGYADAAHSHTPEDIGAATADHSHDYAATTHTHAQADVTGLAAALSTKANVSAMSAKADLVDGKVPTSQLPSYVDDVIDGTLVNATTFNDVDGVAVVPESGKVYNDTDESKSYRWSGSQYVALNEGVALGETSATAYRGDRGKTAYDHSQNATVHVTEAQKTAWDGKAAGNHVHSYNALTDKPTIPTIPASLPANGGNADTVDNMHASDFAAAVHSHDTAYIAKTLQMVADNGNVEYEMAGLDVLATMAAMPCGMHTGYCPMSSLNAPKQTEAWRFLVHKTGTSKNYGWVMAFGSRGSVYSNYIDAGSWRGWKCIHDIEPEPLWTGAMYMTGGHTVTPTKTLSECRNGWMLLWSDYDPGDAENNYDFSVTMIPKRAYTGQKWGGGQFLCMVPCHFAADSHNHITKCLHVHDTKIVGHENNSVVDRNDVVLRAVYEF